MMVVVCWQELYFIHSFHVNALQKGQSRRATRSGGPFDVPGTCTCCVQIETRHHIMANATR